MFDKELQGYKKAFVFGTGGGNDIVSSVLIAMYMQKQGIKTDIGGVLSPGAVHTFNGNLEEVVNEINENVKRRVDCRDPISISFIDDLLPEFAREAGIKVDCFYDLSIRYGTTALVDGVNNLVKRNGYDLVVAVDMGGDILARGPQDATILSPAMDFTSLYLLGQLDVDSILVEFGLGTDGELRPEGMDQIIQELRGKNVICSESVIGSSDPEVIKFRELFEKIKGTRPGHATEMTLCTLDTITPDEDIVSQYRFTSRVGRKVWLTPFQVILPSQYFGKVYVIDGKELASQRSETAFPYENSLEFYVKLKEVPTWKTELDLLYLWSGDNWTTPRQEGYCMLLLAPSKLIPEKDRNEIILEGISQSNRVKCDLALVLKDDSQYFSSYVKHVLEAGNFVVGTQRDDLMDFLQETAIKVQQYQSL